MLLLEGFISNFTCAKYYFLYVEFSDFYMNQSLAGQTIVVSARFFNILTRGLCNDEVTIKKLSSVLLF
jgi:hypothetical protein